jgi:hypothetical protein
MRRAHYDRARLRSRHYGALRENRNRNLIAPAAMPVFIGSTEALRAEQAIDAEGG